MRDIKQNQKDPMFAPRPWHLFKKVIGLRLSKPDFDFRLELGDSIFNQGISLAFIRLCSKFKGSGSSRLDPQKAEAQIGPKNGLVLKNGLVPPLQKHFFFDTFLV